MTHPPTPLFLTVISPASQKLKEGNSLSYLMMIMSNTYVIIMKDVLDGKIQPDSIEPQYIIVRALRISPKKFMEGINYMAKFGWRPVGYTEDWNPQCLMERVE